MKLLTEIILFCTILLLCIILFRNNTFQISEPLESMETHYKLKEEIKKLEESNKILTQLKDELEQKLEEKALKGDFLTPNTKVLHFRYLYI